MTVLTDRLDPRGGDLVVAVIAAALGALIAGVAAGQPLLIGGALAAAFGLACLASFSLTTVVLLTIVVMRLAEVGARDYGVPTLLLPLSVGIVVLVFLSGERSEYASRQVARALFIVLPYIAAMLASTLVAGDPTRSMVIFSSTVRDIATVAAVVALVSSVQRLRVALWAIIGSGGVLALMGAVQNATGTHSAAFGGLMGAMQPAVIGGSDQFELAGPENSPNFFAKTLMVVVLLAAERALNDRRRVPRLIAVSIVGVATTALYFTYSRAALIALACGVLVLLVGLARRQRRLLLGVVFGAGALFLASNPSFLKHLELVTPGASQTSSAAQADNSVVGRVSEYRAAYDMWLDHPVLGVGRKNYDRLYQSYASHYGLDDRAGERGVPNTWLEVLAEMGTIGLLTMAAVPVAMIVMLRRSRRQFRATGDTDSADIMWGLVSATIAFIVVSMFQGGRSIYMLWVLFALAVAADGLSSEGVLPRTSATASDTVGRSNSATQPA